MSHYQQSECFLSDCEHGVPEREEEVGQIRHWIPIQVAEAVGQHVVEVGRLLALRSLRQRHLFLLLVVLPDVVVIRAGEGQVALHRVRVGKLRHLEEDHVSNKHQFGAQCCQVAKSRCEREIRGVMRQGAPKVLNTY